MALTSLLTAILLLSEYGLSEASLFGIRNGRSIPTSTRRTNRKIATKTVETLRGGAADGNKIDGPCIGIDLGKETKQKLFQLSHCTRSSAHGVVTLSDCPRVFRDDIQLRCCVEEQSRRRLPERAREQNHSQLCGILSGWYTVDRGCCKEPGSE